MTHPLKLSHPLCTCSSCCVRTDRKERRPLRSHAGPLPPHRTCPAHQEFPPCNYVVAIPSDEVGAFRVPECHGNGGIARCGSATMCIASSEMPRPPVFEIVLPSIPPQVAWYWREAMCRVTGTPSTAAGIFERPSITWTFESVGCSTTGVCVSVCAYNRVKYGSVPNVFVRWISPC